MRIGTNVISRDVTARWLAALALLFLAAASADVLGARRERLARMSPAERERLLDKYERYERLSEAERQRLRKLDQEINAAADGATLRETLQRYDAFLNKLPAVQRQELLSLPADDRLKKIVEMRRGERRDMPHRLSASDTQKVADYVEQTLKRLSPADAERLVRRFTMQFNFAGDQGRPFNFNEFATMRDELSPAARDELVGVDTPQKKMEILGSWIRQGMLALATRNIAAHQQEMTPERMWRFLQEEVSEADRRRLLSLPAEEMRQQVWRLYQLYHLLPNRPTKPGDAANPARLRLAGELPGANRSGEQPFRRPGGNMGQNGMPGSKGGNLPNGGTPRQLRNSDSTQPQPPAEPPKPAAPGP